MKNVQRIIASYDKANEDLISEFPIDLSLNILNNIFSPSPKDDFYFYFVYEIKIEQAIAIKEFIKFDFDFANYVYFLECYSVNPHL